MSKRIIHKVPQFGDEGADVLFLQTALNEAGIDPGPLDGRYGIKTDSALRIFGIRKNISITDKEILLAALGLELEKKQRTPWGAFFKKYEGSRETDSKFGKFMSGFWGYVGLKGFTSIVGSKRAWCGLAVAAALITGGYAYQQNGAGAKNWDRYGQAINWRVDGIPRDAIVRINHGFNCSSGSGNHVAISDADCTAADILKKDAVIPLLGGNQGQQLKRSIYSAKEICTVRWPDKKDDGTKVPLPPPVKVSNGCNGKAAKDESTR